MEKRNQDYCKADAIAGLAALVDSGAGCVSDDYGLLESLASDALSPNEARRFAEHLKSCEECRRECAALWDAGVYDDAPFGDRMRAFVDDPCAETDEDWKTIALAFRGAVVSESTLDCVNYCAPSPAPIANDIYVAPEFEQVLADWNASRPKAREKAESRRVFAKWPAFAYSAAALLLVAVAAQFMETAPPRPVDENQIAMETKTSDVGSRAVTSPSSDEPRETETAQEETDASAKPKGGSPAFGVAESKGVAPFPASDGAADFAASGASAVADEAAPSAVVDEAARERLQYELLQVWSPNLAWFDGAVELHEQGLAAFNAANFADAAQKFGKLVGLIEANAESADADADDVNDALVDAYWNWGVATAQSGEKKRAAGIFGKLKKMEMSDRKRKDVQDALEAWGK